MIRERRATRSIVSAIVPALCRSDDHSSTSTTTPPTHEHLSPSLFEIHIAHPHSNVPKQLRTSGRPPPFLVLLGAAVLANQSASVSLLHNHTPTSPGGALALAPRNKSSTTTNLSLPTPVIPHECALVYSGPHLPNQTPDWGLQERTGTSKVSSGTTQGRNLIMLRASGYSEDTRHLRYACKHF